MTTKTVLPPEPPVNPADTPAESERDQISQNIDAVLDFYTREEQKISRSQRMTEQKASKLIDLMEELRRDLPNVKNRHDPEAAALQHSMNPELVLAALDQRAEPEAAAKPAENLAAEAGGAA